MEKKQFVRDLQAKDSVDSIFIVKYLSLMEARDGKNYLNIILADKSGDLEARKWHGGEKVVSEISRGSFVKVTAKVNQYQGRLQAIISEIYKIENNEINMEDFITRSDRSVDQMFEELKNCIYQIKDVYIKELVRTIYEKEDIICKIKEWPAGKSIHHSYAGGLLEHILSCARIAQNVIPLYKVNGDYVLAGILLHDIAKIFELTNGPLYEYTEEGHLIGHLIKASEMIEKCASKIPNFPHKTKVHLKHILLSHHGEIEYGSAKRPQTSEAMLVHLIDLMDSKMGAFEEIKKNDNQVGHWSNYVKHLDRVIFKGDLVSHHNLPDENVNTNVNTNDSLNNNSNNNRNKNNTKLTHNMSSMLKNFRIETNNGNDDDI